MKINRLWRILAICLVVLMSGIVPAQQASALTTSSGVAVGSDDAEESATGSVDLKSSDLELVTESTVQTVGIRFAGVAIPKGATVTNAYIQFTTDRNSSAATSLTVAGQAADSAATFVKATQKYL